MTEDPKTPVTGKRFGASTLAGRLHASATHAKGFDANCPECREEEALLAFANDPGSARERLGKWGHLAAGSEPEL